MKVIGKNAHTAGLGTGFDGASMPATECSPIGRARDAMSIPDTCSDFDQRDFAGLLEENTGKVIPGGCDIKCTD